MHFKQKRTYIAFGCLLTLAGYILASLGSDGVAQSGTEDVTFGKIACRQLNVINGEGVEQVELRTDWYGSVVVAIGKESGVASLSINGLADLGQLEWSPKKIYTVIATL